MTCHSKGVGYWGVVDVESFGPALSARVAKSEIARRLPGVEVRMLAPLGRRHPVRADGGEPAEPLGRWGPGPAAALAGELGCLVIAGELVLDPRQLETLYRTGTEVASDAMVDLQLDGLGPGLESDCPVVWHAVSVPEEIDADHASRLVDTLSRLPLVSVRDEASKRRLKAIGFGGEIAIVADPVALVTRLIPDDLLQKRLTYLRLMGWYPPSGEPLFVHGDQEILPYVPELVEALAEVVAVHGVTAVVIAALGPDERRLFGLLADAFEVPVFQLPGDVGQEDVVAAIAAATGVVGNSLHAATVALAFGRPHVPLEPGQAADLVGAYAEAAASAQAGASSDLATLVKDLDIQFDRLAALVGNRSAEGQVRRLEQELVTLRRAHDARSGALAAERSMYADRVVDLEADIAELTDERDEARHRGEVESKGRLLAEQEIAAIYGTYIFRWTATARVAYSRLRSIGRRL